MGSSAIVALLFVLGGFAFGQDDPNRTTEKEAEAKAKKRLEEFRTEIKKCKSTGDYVSALDGLGDEQHPLILSELKGWLTKPIPDVRMEAADELGKFKKNEKAAQTLVTAAKSERVPDVAGKFLREVAKMGVRTVARDLVPLFGHKNVSVAKEAVDACGVLKSKDVIDPLINLLAELEVEKERLDQNHNTHSTTGLGPNPGGNLPGSNNPNTRDDEKRDRVDGLLPRCLQALRDITGEKLTTSKEWKKWWVKNRATWKEPSID